MGLYISNVKNFREDRESLDSIIRCVSRRKASYIFFAFENNVYLYFNHSVTKILESNDLLRQYAVAVCQYASRNNIDSFEIFLTRDQELSQYSLEYSLDYLYHYVSEREASIGLLARSEYFIEENEDLLYLCGVVYADREAQYKLEEPRIRNNYYEMLSMPSMAPSSEEQKKNRKMRRATGCALRPRPDVDLEESFHEKFMRFYIESMMDAPEVYNRGGISRQVFSKILSNSDFIPKKETILCLAIGLELSVYQTRELLESAGYTLSRSLVVDSVVERFIRDEIYDIDQINVRLNDLRYPLLGWRPREENSLRERYPQLKR